MLEAMDVELTDERLNDLEERLGLDHRWAVHLA